MSVGRKDMKNEDKEFSFIQEKIIPRKTNKAKKLILIFLFTIILAVIFGLVARYVFCVSESFFQEAFGLSEKKGTISFPSNEPTNTKNVENEPNKEHEAKQEEKEPNKTIVIENSVEADVADYVTMYSKIGEVADQVNQSIVTVTSAKKAIDWFNNDYETKSITSGTILAIDELNLYVLTNDNKLKSTSNIKITLVDNITLEGEFQRSDSELNLAIITVPVTEIPDNSLKKVKAATLGESSLLSVGDPIIALGNPNGYSSSIELGMITNKTNSIYTIDNKLELFNTDINDNPDGEGVIANMDGEIIGIITQNFKANLNKNINTVISISRLKPIIEKLVNDKPLAYLGIVGADMTTEIAKGYDLSFGIYVTEVKAKSPAFKAGIKNGDIILMIGDKKVTSMMSLNNILLEYNPEDKIHLVIKRTTIDDSDEGTIDVTLGNKE